MMSNWLIDIGCNVQKAAGSIHSDFEKKFIAADVSKVNDWIEYKSEKLINSKGLLNKKDSS